MIRTLAKEDVTMHINQGSDQWNSPLPTTDVTVKAKVIEETHLVRNAIGEQTVSSTQLLIADRTVTNEDAFTVRGLKADVIKWARLSDWGIQYVKVWLE